jgi:DNA/RNA-binding domain of Phe-tRNA-synthetase-like protein
VTLFAYDPAITERYPGIHAAVIHVTGVVNGPSPPQLLAEYRDQQRAAGERAAGTPLAELPSIAAWRRAFTAFGAKPTQYRNAAEALLRRLDKQGEIPSLSALVDMGNLVSIRFALPVAAFDLDRVAGSVTVRFASGQEPFTDLGASEAVRPDPGEVVFTDREGVVCARRWCWRQSAQSATGPDTTDVLFVIEAHHDSAREDVAAAAEALTALLAEHRAGARATVSYSP